MRGLKFSAAALLALALVLSSVGQAANRIPKTANINLPYPDQIDLTQEPAGWTFRQAVTDLPLYMSTADLPGKSSCNEDCAKQWIPLTAAAGAKPLGEWSIIERKDGQRQWAFKDHPVYTHIHDTAETPTGDGAHGVWHVMPHFH